MKKRFFATALLISGLCLPTSALAADQIDQAGHVSDSTVQAIGCRKPGGVAERGHCVLMADVDLTFPFHTRATWDFVVTQGSGGPNDGDPLRFCFLKDGVANCSDPAANAMFRLNDLQEAALVYPRPKAFEPILVVKAHCVTEGPGSLIVYTRIWTYDSGEGKFKQVWADASYPGRNEETRIVTRGALAGDIVVAVNDPTGRWPYPYGIAVYRLFQGRTYVRILDFVGKSAQLAEPPGAVIDADMPEIMYRLRRVAR